MNWHWHLIICIDRGKIKLKWKIKKINNFKGWPFWCETSEHFVGWTRPCPSHRFWVFKSRIQKPLSFYYPKILIFLISKKPSIIYAGWLNVWQTENWPPHSRALAPIWPRKYCWPHWATWPAMIGAWIGGLWAVAFMKCCEAEHRMNIRPVSLPFKWVFISIKILF